MGRPGANASNHHHHHHQQDAQDLYEPPPPPMDASDDDYPKKPVKSSDAHHQDQESAAAFPPPDDAHEPDKPHAFPPPQSGKHTHQDFPHPGTRMGMGMGMGTGIPMGHPIPQQSHTPPAAFTQFHSQLPPAAMPSPIPGQPQNQPWKTHLFDCMRDPQNAIITLLFPCVTFGQIAEIVDSGGTSCGTSGMLYTLIACCIAMPCIMSCSYRSKMRSRFGLAESPAPDWLVHCFCECCALCQEYRELQLRGIDPSIGWVGNVARQQQLAMTPPGQQRMMI